MICMSSKRFQRQNSHLLLKKFFLIVRIVKYMVDMGRYYFRVSMLLPEDVAQNWCVWRRNIQGARHDATVAPLKN
jgi:hypothetical protein